MSMHCDLHAVNHDLRTEVRVCGDGPRTLSGEPFVVIELRVGDGYVTLFLSPDQALELAQSISRFIKPLDEADESDAEALPEREVS